MSQRDRGGTAPRAPIGRDQDAADEAGGPAARDRGVARSRSAEDDRGARRSFDQRTGRDADRPADRAPGRDADVRDAEQRGATGSRDARGRDAGRREAASRVAGEDDRRSPERRVTYGSSATGGVAASRSVPPIRSAPARDPYADPYSDTDEPEAPPRFAGATRSSRLPGSTAGRDDDDPLSARAWLEADDEWADDAPPEVAPTADPAPARRRATRAAGRPAQARGRPRVAPTLPTVQIPAFLARSDLVSDRVALGLLGAAVVGVIAMALVLASQIGRLPDGLVVHLDAAGIPDRWGAPRLLWRLPLIAVATTLMNLAVAWFLAPIDRFGSRFVLAAALVVQLLAWVAVFDFIRG